MRMFTVLVAMTLLVAALSQMAVAQTPRITGRTLVIMGDGAWYRGQSVIDGVEAALATLPGVTVVIPRSRPWSLRDADLSGIESVVLIQKVEVHRQDQPQFSISFTGGSVSAILTKVRARVGLQFLRVIPGANYLEFVGAAEGGAEISGYTYFAGSFWQSGFGGSGSLALTTLLVMETSAMTEATNQALKQLGWK